LRLFDEPCRVGPVGELEPAQERLSCLAATVCPAQHTPQVDERPGLLELGSGRSEHRNSVAELGLAAAPALHQS
jgi:hypothetical protein